MKSENERTLVEQLGPPNEPDPDDDPIHGAPGLDPDADSEDPPGLA